MVAQFITFEGGEGSGKSTQITLLSEVMEEAGVPHIKTREPGGVPLAESIRDMLVNSGDHEPGANTELLLFQAARIAHVEQCIKPALADGQWVLCDRFADSTRVYQGIGRDLGVEYINRLYNLTLGNFQPHMTLLLDIDPEKGLRRSLRREGEELRFEELGLEFHQNIREGFLSLAAQENERFITMDAGVSIAQLHCQIIDTLNARFALSLLPKTVDIR